MQQHLTTASLDLANLVKASLYGFNARAGSALGTAPSPTGQEPARPPYQQSEADIQRGHAERRERLARRRAEQQLTVLLTDSQRLGVSLSTEVMARTVITAYTDTLAVSRR